MAGPSGALTPEQTRELVRRRSPLPEQDTESLIARRFDHLPRRLSFALARWPLRESRVLDVGCSYGHCLLHFGAGSVGVDNVAEHVEFCRALGLDARLVDVDGSAALPEGPFEYAWVSDILEHLDSPRLLLRRLRQVLAPNGRILLNLTILPRSRLLRTALRRTGRGRFDSRAHHYQLTYETAVYLLERCGYRVVTTEVPPLPPRLHVLSRGLRQNAPMLFFEAAPDDAAEQLAAFAEAKNKPPGGTV
jgi:SAM-dependent methyltransferase